MNLLNIGMIELTRGIYAKVVRKGSCTAEFNTIIREISGGFKYLPISTDDEEKMNGYADLIKDIEVDYENENLIIIKTNGTNN